MAGYIGTKAVALSTTTGNILGDMTVGGTTDVATLEFNSLSGTGAVTITDILDEDNLASNSATKLATQQSIKAYVDTQVNTVDTLAEILAVGNRTSGAGKIEFRDANLFINSSTSGQLDIAANTEIELTATTVDVQGNFTNSGTIVSTGVVTANAGVVVDEMTLDGDTLTATDTFTIDATTAITLDSDTGVIDFDDNGLNIGRIENSSSDFKIESRVQNKDIVFAGNDNNVGVTALTLDMSDAGTALFNHDIATGLNGQLQARDAAGDISVSIDNLSSGSNSGRISIDPANSASGSYLQIWIDNAAKYTFENDGDFNILDGNLVIGTAGHGIDFSAQTPTSVTGASTANELLNHYERGTWTPGFEDSAGNAYDLSGFSNFKGQYVRIGDYVFLNFFVNVGGTLSGTTSFLKVTGLPFHIVNTLGNLTAGAVYTFGGFTGLGSGDSLIFRTQVNEAVGFLQVVNGGTGRNVTNSDFGGAMSTAISFSYRCV